MDTLLMVLEASLKKHGDKPVTLSHLINLIKMAQRIETKNQEKHDRLLDEAYMEILASQCGDKD